jgi:hypothetical protein
MNILKEFYDARDEGKREHITPQNVTLISGVQAYFYKIGDRIFVHYLDSNGFEVVGEVSSSYENEAKNIEFDPHNDSGYARQVIDLALYALRNALYHQTGKQKTSRKGGW